MNSKKESSRNRDLDSVKKKLDDVNEQIISALESVAHLTPYSSEL